MDARSQARVKHASQFGLSALVGLLATAADLAVLSLLIEGLAVAPVLANVPALVTGALLQFLGCRLVVFRARGGCLRDQLQGFILAELGTLLLNGIGFHLLVSWAGLGYASARLLGSLLVYTCFSFPMWRRVFRAPAPPAQPARFGRRLTTLPTGMPRSSSRGSRYVG